MNDAKEMSLKSSQTPFLLRPRFSILALIGLIGLAALAISQFSMIQSLREASAEVAAARDEVEAFRNEFGSLDVNDTALLHVGRIKSRPGSYRLKVPPGHRLLVHLTETKFPTEAYPENPEPTKTLSMNSWRDGADVILTWRIFKDGTNMRCIVSTNDEELFDYTLEDWKEGPMPNSITYATSLTENQTTFRPDETIPLMKWLNDSTRRGVMIWLEPAEKRYPTR